MNAWAAPTLRLLHSIESTAKAFNGFEQTLAVDNGNDQHVPIFDPVDEAVTVDETFAVGRFEFGDIAAP